MIPMIQMKSKKYGLGSGCYAEPRVGESIEKNVNNIILRFTR